MPHIVRILAGKQWMQNSFIYQVFSPIPPNFPTSSNSYTGYPESVFPDRPPDRYMPWAFVEHFFSNSAFPVDFSPSAFTTVCGKLFFLSLLHLPPQTCIGLSVQSKGAQPDHQQKQCTKSLEFLHSYSIVISFYFFMRIRNQTIKIYLYD